MAGFVSRSLGEGLGAGSREQGAGGREQGAESREQRAKGLEMGFTLSP